MLCLRVLHPIRNRLSDKFVENTWNALIKLNKQKTIAGAAVALSEINKNPYGVRCAVHRLNEVFVEYSSYCIYLFYACLGAYRLYDLVNRIECPLLPIFAVPEGRSDAAI